jgi:hypothetical protein
MAKKPPVSQSRTEWVKKGTIVNGKAVPKGYLAQKGKPEKKVSATVSMVTGGQAGMGASATYKQGRRVQPKSVASKANAGKRDMGAGSKGGATKPPSSSTAEKARQMRLQQNKGVKGGTVRVGAAGRSVRKYNAKTGRWDRVATRTGSGSRSATSATVSSATAAAKSRKPSRSATSGTVSSAIAAGNAKGKQFSTRSPLSVKGFGERVGISLGRAAMTAAKARKILAEGASVHSDSVLNAARKFIEGK